FLLDVEAMLAIDEGERGDDIAVDAVDLAIEGEGMVVFAVQRAAVGAVLIVAALEAFERDLCEVVDVQVGVECGGEGEGAVAAVFDSEGGGEPGVGEGDRQTTGEDMW